MPRPYSVCIFCGSRVGENPAHAEGAALAGRTVAENGWRLVYGGGGVGLMCIAADAALQAGGPVIGVIPEFLRVREAGHDGVDDLIVTDGMHDRKQIMFNLADAFLILPGGVGTMDETVEILTWKQLGNHKKPIVIVNQGGYWDLLLATFDRAVEEGYMGADTVALLDIVDSVEAAMDLLKDRQAS